MLPGKRWTAGFSRNAASTRVGRGDRARVERPQPLLDLQRPAERGLYGHLLVEREPDQQRERLLRDQCVGLVVAGEVEPVGCGHGHVTILPF